MGLNNRSGEIVLLEFPYTNAAGSKVRPAVILYDETTSSRFGDDFIVAYMTTEIDNYAFSPGAVMVENSDLAYGQLKKPSIIRTDKVITVNEKIFKRAQVAGLGKAKLKELFKTASNAVVANYYQAIHNHGQTATFVPGTSHVNYAGRVFDEREMVNLVDSCLDFWLTAGRYAQKFENDLARVLGVKYCLLVNSGSSANLLALMALTSPKLGRRRITPGDEVITVAVGFPTTVAPILQAGAVPVFVDVHLPDANVDVENLEKALSPKTRAVILAHTLGFPFDLQGVKEFCDRHGLWLVEDNCDALGSRYLLGGQWRYTGTIGHMGTSSFYPPHHITMGEGGAVYTDSKELKRIVESMRDWGRDCWCPPGKDNTCKKRFDQQFGTLPFGYDHKYVYSHFGYNLKVTDMQAAIGCAQIEKLDQFTRQRKANFQRLHSGLINLSHVFQLPEITPDIDPSPFGFLLIVHESAGFTRNSVTNYLESCNIQTRNLFAGYLTRHPCFDHLEPGRHFRIVGELVNTDKIMHDGFWLGVYPGMTNEMIDYMIQSLQKFVEGK